MTISVLTAGSGAEWEHEFLTCANHVDSRVDVVRRCVDVADLLVAAAVGQAGVAVVDGDLRRLDTDAISRLAASGVRVIAVHRNDPGIADRLRRMGIPVTLSADVGAEAIIAAVQELPDLPPVDTWALGSVNAVPLTDPATGVGGPTGPGFTGQVLAIWGPTGAPGRTTVALGVAWEAAAAGIPTLLIDADSYGGVIANALGLLDESPGLAAACRIAAGGTLTHTDLAALCWQVGPLQVLTGIARADRWPEIRASAISDLLAVATSAAALIVLDCGFCLEADEELSFDTLAPRRNGATLALLAAADLIWVVGSADPPGLERLVRGLSQLSEVPTRAGAQVVLNRVRASAASPLDAVTSLARFSDRPVIAALPEDRAATDRAWREGRSLAEVAPGAPLRKALAELTQHAIARVRLPAVAR